MEFIQHFSCLGLVGICLALVRMMNGRLKNKVTRPECHQAQDAVKQRIDDLQGHIDTRIDDLKELIKNGGKDG